MPPKQERADGARDTAPAAEELLLPYHRLQFPPYRVSERFEKAGIEKPAWIEMRANTALEQLGEVVLLEEVELRSVLQFHAAKQLSKSAKHQLPVGDAVMRWGEGPKPRCFVHRWPASIRAAAIHDGSEALRRRPLLRCLCSAPHR